MLSPPPRPLSSSTTGLTPRRKVSANHSISVKSPTSLTRLFSAQSHRTSTGNLKEKLDGTISPMVEPSTPSSFTGTIRSRPFSRGFKAASPNDLLSSRVQTAQSTAKGSRGHLTSILESATKGWKLHKEKPKMKNTEKSEIEFSRESLMLDNAIAGKSRLMSPGSISETSSPRMSFLALVSATVKSSKQEMIETELALQVKRRKDRHDSLMKPIKHTDIELSVATKEDKEMVEEYENEILGTYKNYRDIRDINSSKIIKKIEYLKLLRLKLREDDKRGTILTLIKTRKTIKKCLDEKELKMVVQELKENLKSIIKLNDVQLLIEILHLISDTYLDFGQLDNAVFAFNQLRMGCELTDNIVMKIEAYMGMAEACKRLKYFDQALVFLKRALNFCWNILDRERELKIFDLIGMIYFTVRDIDKASYYHQRASQGRIERENSPLFKAAKEMISTYRLQYHLSLRFIAPVFFIKLTIPKPAAQKSTFKTKVGREKMRALLVKSTEHVEDYFEEEVTINQASAFLDKVMTRVYYKKGLDKHNDPKAFGNMLNTDIEAIHQLEVIMTEPDFLREIPSPRTFDIKERLEPEKPTKASDYYKQSKAENNGLGILDNQRTVISPTQYHNLKKDRKRYSLQQIAKENHISLKSPTGDIETAMDKPDLFITFETFKRQAKREYNSDLIEAKMFLNHLSPNRNTHGIPNIPDVKPQKYSKFFEKALEYIVYEKEFLNKP